MKTPGLVTRRTGMSRSHGPRQFNTAFQNVCSPTARPRPQSAWGENENRPSLFQDVAATITAIPVQGRCPNGVTELRSSRTLWTSWTLVWSALNPYASDSMTANPAAETSARASADSTARYFGTSEQKANATSTLDTSSVTAIDNQPPPWG